MSRLSPNKIMSSTWPGHPKAIQAQASPSHTMAKLALASSCQPVKLCPPIARSAHGHTMARPVQAIAWPSQAWTPNDQSSPQPGEARPAHAQTRTGTGQSIRRPMACPCTVKSHSRPGHGHSHDSLDCLFYSMDRPANYQAWPCP
jgi:hypothetical protein